MSHVFRLHKPIKVPEKWREEPYLSCFLKGVLKGVGISLGENYQSLDYEEAAERIKTKQLYHDRQMTVGMALTKEKDTPKEIEGGN